MEKQGTLIVQVQNAQSQKGKIAIAVFSTPDKFPQAAFACTSALGDTDKSGITNFRLPNLPFGTYAIAAFHDLNGNGKLDTNVMGIPSEPYGFSNNIRAKWSSPTFEDARFSLQDAEKRVIITLKSWQEW